MRVVPLRRRVMTAAGSPTIQYVTVHGHQRAYLAAGSGPALLLLHGIGSKAETWERVIPELARDHTVIAPDLLGHGHSDKPRADYSLGAYANGMRDLLTVLGIERASVVGHSFGGGVAMQFAYQFPERCERVVLVGSGGVGRAVHPLLRAMTLPGSGLLTQAVTGPLVRPVVTRLGSLVAKAPLDATVDIPELLTVLEDLGQPHGRRAFLRLLRNVIDLQGQSISMMDRLYLSQRMPMLLVWGGKDSVIPVKHAHRAHAAMPGSQLVVLPGAGHFPHKDEPGTFVDEVRRFLSTTAPSVFDPVAWQEMLLHGPRRPLSEQMIASAQAMDAQA